MPSRYGPLRGVAELQMTLQSELSDTYDTHALGVMGLSGALVAVAIAGRDFLEHLWWISLFGLFASIASCVVALSTHAQNQGLDPTDPEGAYGALNEAQMDAVIVGNLHASWAENDPRVRFKRRAVRVALYILGGTFIVATLLASVVS